MLTSQPNTRAFLCGPDGKRPAIIQHHLGGAPDAV
jgi:hypothetical protein